MAESKLRRLVSLLRCRGAGYPLRWLVQDLAPRLAMDVSLRTPLGRWLLRTGGAPAVVPSSMEPTASVASSAVLQAEEWLPASTWAAVRELADSGEPVVIGQVDNDGRVLCPLGPLPDMDEVTAAEFVPRYRFDLDLVVLDGLIAVRKDYRGNRTAFLHESAALTALQDSGAAPLVLRVEAERQRLFKSFLPGPTLRHRLVEKGAKILSVDTERDPALTALDPGARIEAVWARGREALQRLVHDLDCDLVGQMSRCLDEVHRRGVTGFSLTFGNVVLAPTTDTADSVVDPRFLDFDAAVVHSGPSGLRFHLARDRDRRLFCSVYGLDLVTETSARDALRRLATPYSPVDLGRGLASRGFWSVDSGTGRWQYLNGPALQGLLKGRRILDLGSFNGLMPLHMLADGARQVVALERSPEMMPIAEGLRRLFEWRHMRPMDLKMLCADMRAVVGQDWGSFDVVTAFCSLYYLEEADMVRVVRRAAELAPVMVLQAKTDTRKQAGDDKARKSSLEFLGRLLRENGFPVVENIAPRGYSRPLLIGRKVST